MITEVKLPEIGSNVEEVTILRWLKVEGDEVGRGEPIVELETEKANFDLEADVSGIILRILAREGETLAIGALIAVLGAEGDDVSVYGETAAVAAEVTKTRLERPSEDTPERATRNADTTGVQEVEEELPAKRSKALVSPLARRLAQEFGVDLTKLTGTGSSGRIILRDVEAELEPPLAVHSQSGRAFEVPDIAPTATEPQGVPLTRMRQIIARRMLDSKRSVPHYYLQIDVEMTEVLRLRAEQNESLGEADHISINDVIVMAVARTLVQHPKFNSWYSEDRLRLQSRVNVGLAVALDGGLVVPAIADCGKKGLLEISSEARDLVTRAREGELRADEMSATTFTISNLGHMGIQSPVAIINPPQVAILAVGVVEDRPVVREGAIVVRQMMSMVLSADHRVSDGADGARFLQTLRANLEKPELMLL